MLAGVCGGKECPETDDVDGLDHFALRRSTVATRSGMPRESWRTSPWKSIEAVTINAERLAQFVSALARERRKVT